MTLLIRPQTVDEDAVVRSVVAAAFAHHEGVDDLVDALRESWAWVDGLSLVADEDGEVVGHVLLTKAILDAPERLVGRTGPEPAVRPARSAARRDRQGAGTCCRADRRGARRAPALSRGRPGLLRPREDSSRGPLGFRRPSTRIPEPAFQVMPLATYEKWMTGHAGLLRRVLATRLRGAAALRMVSVQRDDASSLWSLWSEDSILSIGSKGSVLSIALDRVGGLDGLARLDDVAALDRLVPVHGVRTCRSSPTVRTLSGQANRSVLSWRSNGGVLQAEERGPLDSSRWPGVAIAAASGLVVGAWLWRSRSDVRR